MLFKLKIITLLSLLPFTPPLKSSNHTHTPEDVLSLSCVSSHLTETSLGSLEEIWYSSPRSNKFRKYFNLTRNKPNNGFFCLLGIISEVNVMKISSFLASVLTFWEQSPGGQSLGEDNRKKKEKKKRLRFYANYAVSFKCRC